MKIKFKQRVESRILLGGQGVGGAFYRLNLSSQQCTKAIIVKHKLRYLQWLKFLLKKVNSSIELWHKLTLKVSKKTPAPSVLIRIPTQASTAPTKKSKVSLLEGVIFSQRGKLLFFQTFPLQSYPFTMYFQFDDAKLITEFYATMASSSHFFKTWNNLPRSKNIPPKSLYVRAPQVKMLCLSNAKNRSEGP